MCEVMKKCATRRQKDFVTVLTEVRGRVMCGVVIV